jgi:hypothetical protein
MKIKDAKSQVDGSNVVMVVEPELVPVGPVFEEREALYAATAP